MTDQQLLEDWKQSFKQQYPKGYVISQGEINRYDDSSFYEWLWLDDESRVQQVDTGCTNFWFPSHESHLPSIWTAPQEVQDRFKAFAVKKALETQRQYCEGSAELFASTIANGSTVKVVKKYQPRNGFPVLPGAIGKVVWSGQDSYSSKARYGVEFPDGETVYLNEDKLELVPDKKVSEAKIDQHMQDFAKTIASADLRGLIGWVIGRPHSKSDYKAYFGEQFCEPLA